MAYTIEKGTGDIVISGFDQGIAPSPYTGITDLKSVNISSIAKEASVSFSTGLVSKAPKTGSQTTSVTTGTNNLLVPAALNTESYQWVIFTSVGTSGLSLNTPYLIFYNGTSGSNIQYQLFTKNSGGFPPVTQATISANSAVTWSTIVPSNINYFQHSLSNNFALDSNGRVWSDRYFTGTGGGTATNSWVYLGNDTDSTSDGNGLLVFTTVHDGTGGNQAGSSPTQLDEWLFVWRRSQIDYTQISSAGSLSSIVWVDGWNYKLTTGTTTGHTGYLNTNTSVPNSHHALVTPDARANFVDGNFIGNFYQNIPTPGTNYTGFNPATGGTWTPSTITAVIPADDVGQCLAFVNQYLLVGGRYNFIYPWDLNPGSNTYSTPLIQLPENNIAAIVTVGNNAYIFAGNRGNIYITNGSQASPYKKVPDHISGSVEPLFQWGNGMMTAQCAAYSKNRLYFGCNANLQSGGTATGYGGLWCIDLIANQGMGSIFNAQQMSYGSYAGFVSSVGQGTAQTANGFSYGPNIGYGLIIGWNDGGTPLFGIDVNISTPYTNGQSWVTSDLIPVGTLLNLNTSHQVEFKLSSPLLATETVELQQGSYLDMSYASFTSLGVVSGSGSQIILSGNKPILQQGQQWSIIRAILTSKSSSPSYNRVTELRIIKA